MNVLLDTCTFLWLITDGPELSDKAREVFSSPDNEIFLSCVSAWEITVKHALGRIHLADPPDVYVPRERERHGIQPLALDEASALHLTKLPPLHKDPFDRMLACQALVHGHVLLTPDDALRQYPVRVIW